LPRNGPNAAAGISNNFPLSDLIISRYNRLVQFQHLRTRLHMLARYRSLHPQTKTELVIVLLFTSMGFFALFALTPVLPLYLADLGITPGEIGLMYSTMGLAFAIGEISWGWLIDRLNTRVALLSGTFAFSAAIGSFLLGDDPAWFYASFFIFGLLIGPAFVLGRWYMGVKAPRSEKAVSMALLSAVISGVSSLAGFTSGFLGETFGYPTVISIAAAVPLVAGIAFVLTKRGFRFRIRDDGDVRRDRIAPAAGPEWRLPVVVSIGVIAAIQASSFGINNAFMALFATRITGVDARGVGIVFGLQGLMRLLAAIPVGRMADRRGKRHFVSLGLAGMAASLMGVALSAEFSWLLISSLGYSLFSSGVSSAYMAMLSERTSQARQGVVMGALGLSEDGGLVIGSGLGGLFWNSFGPRGTFMFGSGMLGLGFLAWLLILRRGVLGEDRGAGDGLRVG
jgi:MFS family permease